MPGLLGVIPRGHRHNLPRTLQGTQKSRPFLASNSDSLVLAEDNSEPMGGLVFYKFLKREKVEVKSMRRIILLTGECFKCGSWQ